jgi:hypothetical protein
MRTLSISYRNNGRRSKLFKIKILLKTYSRASTSREDVKPLMNPDFDLLKREMVEFI